MVLWGGGGVTQMAHDECEDRLGVNGPQRARRTPNARHVKYWLKAVVTQLFTTKST